MERKYEGKEIKINSSKTNFNNLVEIIDDFVSNNDSEMIVSGSYKTGENNRIKGNYQFGIKLIPDDINSLKKSTVSPLQDKDDIK